MGSGGESTRGEFGEMVLSRAERGMYEEQLPLGELWGCGGQRPGVGVTGTVTVTAVVRFTTLWVRGTLLTFQVSSTQGNSAKGPGENGGVRCLFLPVTLNHLTGAEVETRWLGPPL